MRLAWVIPAGVVDQARKGTFRSLVQQSSPALTAASALKSAASWPPAAFTAILTARDSERGALAAKNAGVDFQQLDVTSEDSVQTAISEITRRHSRIDVLVNNAAIHYDTWQALQTRTWSSCETHSIQISLEPWRTSLAAIPLYAPEQVGSQRQRLERRRVPRVDGRRRSFLLRLQSWLERTHQAPRKRTRGTGILVNSVCPGWVATDMGGAVDGLWKQERPV